MGPFGYICTLKSSNSKLVFYYVRYTANSGTIHLEMFHKANAKKKKHQSVEKLLSENELH